MRDDRLMTLAAVKRYRGLWWAALGATAIAAGAIGGLIMLGVRGAADDPVIGWVGDWIKSPGFTGLGAIVAASIAFSGIFLQLKANRERDADAGWWKSFEWASDRGLPRDTSELGLPFEAALDTLNALATAARTDIQKNAVGGVVDEVVRLHQTTINDRVQEPNDPKMPPALPGTDEPGADRSAKVDVANSGSDGSASAILRYVLQQVGTAAESRRASASNYETEVLAALRHQYGTVLPMPGVAAGDVIVQTQSRQLVVEIKWSSGTIVNMYSSKYIRSVDVVISNVRVVNLPPNVEQVVWDPRRDKSSVLRLALDAMR